MGADWGVQSIREAEFSGEGRRDINKPKTTNVATSPAAVNLIQLISNFSLEARLVI